MRRIMCLPWIRTVYMRLRTMSSMWSVARAVVQVSYPFCKVKSLTLCQATKLSKITQESFSDAPTEIENIAVQGRARRQESKQIEAIVEATALTALVAKTNPGLIRLWGVFEQAKKDYIRSAEDENGQTHQAAKFLRDTAENTLDHIGRAAGHVDPRIEAELRQTFETAQQIVVQLSGGRKRKFDRVHDEQVKRTKRESPRQRPTQSDQSRSKHYLSRPLAQLEDRSKQRLHSSSKGIGYRSTTSGSYPFEERRHVDRFRSKQDPKREKIAMKGRGHSGIPFGYSREVDSWCPS